MLNSKLIVALIFCAAILMVLGAADFMRPAPVVVEAPEVPPAEQQFTVWQVTRPSLRGEYTRDVTLSRVVLAESDARKQGINGDILPKLTTTTILRNAKAEGSYLFEEDLAQVGDDDYIEFLITPGKALYPLTISSANLIEGFIRAGDSIDVLAVSSPNANLADARQVSRFDGVKAQMLLEKIRVLSVGQDKKVKKTDSKLSARQDQTNDSRVTIIVEVDPEMIPKVTLAQRTMYLEVYKSHEAKLAPTTYVSDIIDNYTGVIEIRGSQGSLRGEVY
ncbi:hypothetical protein H4F17_03400 [Vibrio cholerae]